MNKSIAAKSKMFTWAFMAAGSKRSTVTAGRRYRAYIRGASELHIIQRCILPVWHLIVLICDIGEGVMTHDL
ncbi:hypothetical protein [Paenibacillus agricola]|uniref:Uncharacterized protein n=1 Tax=Paenibacillus agricola TaxID=2716264 RepID=A0ABX0J9N7_9BACL|nr:hypothetical protein [Paenibacillus agricola]NHN32663.1 hypothetical protein [Paenibacillus agricola]